MSGKRTCNCYYPLEFSLNNVSGLLRFDVFYSKEYNKIVYILGERHDRTDICEPNQYTAKDVFIRLIERGEEENHNLDVFLEAGYDPKKESDRKFKLARYAKAENLEQPQGYLAEAKMELVKKNCGINNNTLCKYKNTRFHSADIRDTFHPAIIYLKYMLEYILYCFMNKTYDDERCKLGLQIINNYPRNQSVEILRKDIDNALKETKIIKQLQNIPDKNKKAKMYILKMYNEAIDKYLPTLTKTLADKLLAYFHKFGGFFVPQDKIYSKTYTPDLYKEFLEIKSIKEIKKFIEDENSKFTNDKSIDKYTDPKKLSRFADIGELEAHIETSNYTSIEQVHNMIKHRLKDYDEKVSHEEIMSIKNTGNFISIIMDMYLAARVFRGFRQVDGQYSEEPKNIVIYAGDFHSGNYSKMFEDLGFTKIFSGKKTNKSNCLDISGMNGWIFL